MVSAAPTSLPLLFSSYLILALSSPPCLLLRHSFYPNLWEELFSLSTSSIKLQWVPGHSFLPGNDSADELAKQAALLVPSAIPCSLSSLISRIHSCLFSDWKHTVTSKFFDTQVPSISTEGLVLLRHVRCVLSRLRCNGHSLLLSSYLSRIGRIKNPSCSACDTRPRTPLISFCTDQPRTLCIARSLAIFCLSATSGPGLGELPSFWGSWSSAMPPFLGRDRVTTTTAKLKLQTHYYVTKGVSKFRHS